jgi:hypothetical protein
MRLLRFFKRASLVLGISAIALMAGVSVYLRIEQYRFRSQAERLLDDVRGLELKKASAADVQRVIARWGFKQLGPEIDSPGGFCPQDNCVYFLRLTPKPVSPDPFIAPLTARVFELLGLRPKDVEAWVHVRGDALYSTSFSVYTVGRGCAWRGCTLVAVTGPKSREFMERS